MTAAADDGSTTNAAATSADKTSAVASFVTTENGLITVTFDPRSDDLDDIYIKAAAAVIEYVLTQNGGNLRRSAG